MVYFSLCEVLSDIVEFCVIFFCVPGKHDLVLCNVVLYCFLCGPYSVYFFIYSIFLSKDSALILWNYVP